MNATQQSPRLEPTPTGQALAIEADQKEPDYFGDV